MDGGGGKSSSVFAWFDAKMRGGGGGGDGDWDDTNEENGVELIEVDKETESDTSDSADEVNV